MRKQKIKSKLHRILYPSILFLIRAFVLPFMLVGFILGAASKVLLSLAHLFCFDPYEAKDVYRNFLKF